MMERILALPQMPLETIARVATKSSEEVSELIATNEDRLLRHPQIIERLYMNKATRMSTSDRMVELAVRNEIELTGIPAFKEAVAALSEELIPVDAPPGPTAEDVEFREVAALAAKVDVDPDDPDLYLTDDVTGQEVPVEQMKPLYARVGEMKTGQKIRLAQTGGVAERELLVRDPDWRVSLAAILNPNVQDNEITRISASRSVSEDVLRCIATDSKWTKSHQVKVNLVMNPRCPSPSRPSSSRTCASTSSGQSPGARTSRAPSQRPPGTSSSARGPRPERGPRPPRTSQWRRGASVAVVVRVGGRRRAAELNT